MTDRARALICGEALIDLVPDADGRLQPHPGGGPFNTAARSAIFEYIEVFYNRERRHATLGNLSPADYESDHAAVCSA